MTAHLPSDVTSTEVFVGLWQCRTTGILYFMLLLKVTICAKNLQQLTVYISDVFIL